MTSSAMPRMIKTRCIAYSKKIHIRSFSTCQRVDSESAMGWMLLSVSFCSCDRSSRAGRWHRDKSALTFTASLAQKVPLVLDMDPVGIEFRQITLLAIAWPGSAAITSTARSPSAAKLPCSFLKPTLPSISVQGTLTKRTLGLEAASGLMSYEVPDIPAMCVAAVLDPAVRGISASRDNQ